MACQGGQKIVFCHQVVCIAFIHVERLYRRLLRRNFRVHILICDFLATAFSMFEQKYLWIEWTYRLEIWYTYLSMVTRRAEPLFSKKKDRRV